MQSTLIESLGVVVVVVFVIILGILWLILPFAIFGIKSRLDTLVKSTRDVGAQTIVSAEEIRQLNAGLAGLTEELRQTKTILGQAHRVANHQ